MKGVFDSMSKRMLLSVLCAVLLTASMLVLPVIRTEAAEDTNTLRVEVLQDLPDFNIYNLGSNSVWRG